MSAFSPARWAALAPLLDELLELPLPERERRLDTLAVSDAGTAADLRSLLQQPEALAEGAQGEARFLDGVASHSLLHGISVLGSAAPGVEPGQTLGPWALVAPLGEGGMGTVWRARRSDGRFDGEAAVKLLRTGLFDTVAQQRFQREGAVLARLQHPGIARLLDAGIGSQGQPYLVIELVEGLPIDRWCRERGLPTRERVQLFLQVIEALAAAHAQLVLHRDLKPANILVQHDGRVRLLDFGIARLLDAEAGGGNAATLTADGQLALTPRYAAPEQVGGAALSTATDVYQLGVVLYELLCGHHPSGQDAAPPLAYMRSAAQAVTVLPSQRADATLARALRGDLDTIVMKALRQAPSERYATATALAHDLERHLAFKPIAARPESLGYVAKRWLQRNRALSAAMAAAVVALVVGVAGILQQAERARVAAVQAREAAALSERERQHAERERDAAEASDEFMAFLLGSRGDRPLSAGELLDRGSAMAAAQFADSPELLARLMLTMAQLQFARDDFKRTDRDLRVAEQAASAARAVGGAAARLAPQAVCLRAADNNFVADREQAAALFARALAELAAPEAADARSVCLSMQAYRAMDDHNPQAALPLLRQALQALGATPRPAHRARAAELRMQIAFAEARQGRIAEGLRTLRAGAEEFEHMGRGDTDAAFVRQTQIAQLEVQAGQWAVARQRFLDARRRAPASHFAGIQMVAAQLFSQMGLHEDAAALIASARAGAAEVGNGQLLAQLDLGYVRCPRDTAPATCVQRVQATRQIVLAQPTISPSTATVEAALGLHLFDGGDLEGAAAALARSLAAYDALPFPRAARAWVGAHAARVALRRGDTAAARRFADEAVAHARRLDPGFEHNAWVGDALLAQAQVLRAVGERTPALAAAQAARRELEAAAGDVPLTAQARRLVAELGGS